MSGDKILIPSIDEALPSGPLRRNRRRAQKETRAAKMGGGRKEGDATSRRAARVSKRDSKTATKSGDMVKGYRVIVSGLHPNTSDSQVRSIFSGVGGRILKCTMGRQAGTNKPVGVAEVVFETSAQADKAARMLNKASVEGRIISVQARGLSFFTKGAKTAKKGRAGAGPKKAKTTGPKKEKKKRETMDDMNKALDAYMK